MLDLFAEGFEERDLGESGVELAVYASPDGEERFWEAFGPGRARDVDPGWLDGWRRFHRAVRVGPVWVGPPWLDADPDAIAVVIEPGRAFGTGAHATTRLCLELLLDVERTSLLELGCGSGVLSIAAAKLGFAPVLALDVDELAVSATRANALANGVSVETRRSDVVGDPLPDAAVVVANIALETVEAVAGRVDAERLITSGYLASERPRATGWTHVDRRERESWAADAFASGDASR